MSDEFCTCPSGRPLGSPHLPGCPDAEGEVLVFRSPDTGRPVGVPHDIVTAADRAFGAWEQKLEGKSWQWIADHSPGGGWPTAAAAQAEVLKYLEEGRQALAGWKRAEITELWRSRLEMLWEAAVPEAKSGKVPSMMAALNIAKTAMTLERLDQPSEEGTNVPTVVIPSEEYIASLQAQGDVQAEAG